MVRSWLVMGTIALAASGCVRDTVDHCANQSGDWSCRGYYDDDARPFCSACVAENHGCLDEPPEKSCHEPGSMPSDIPDDGGTSASATAGSTGATGGGSGDTLSVTTNDVTTMTTDDGGSSTTAPEPECGNGIIEDGEDCEGEDLGGADCSVIDSPGGTLVCTDCKFDPSGCEGFSCGNDAVEGNEECDGDNLAGHSCADVERVATEGTLACSNCLFNTSDCCIPNDEPCAAPSDCCSRNCQSLLPPLTGSQCKP